MVVVAAAVVVVVFGVGVVVVAVVVVTAVVIVANDAAVVVCVVVVVVVVVFHFKAGVERFLQFQKSAVLVVISVAGILNNVRLKLSKSTTWSVENYLILSLEHLCFETLVIRVLSEYLAALTRILNVR